MFAPDDARAVQSLVAKGAMNGGVLETDDCRATYEQLKSRGVVFLQEPVERPYGVEAVFRDDSGNWFEPDGALPLGPPPRTAGLVPRTGR